MHRPLRPLVGGTIVFVCGWVVFGPVGGLRVQAAEEPFDSLPRFVTVRPRYGDGRLLALDIVELRQRSPTFRAALGLLESRAHVRVLVAPAPVRQADGMLGRTTFGMGPDELVAAIDVFVDERSKERTIEAIGHELGHVVEAVCVRGTAVTIKELDARLRPRALRAPGGGAVFETPFADSVGKTVSREYSHPGAAGQLAGLARRYRLRSCAQDAAASGVANAP